MKRSILFLFLIGMIISSFFIFLNTEKVNAQASAVLSCINGEGILASGATGPLSEPYGVAADDAGNVYVSDRVNHVIYKINSNGRTILAGSPGSTGFRSVNEGEVPLINAGTNLNEGLNGPTKLFYVGGFGATFGYGYLYVADSGNNAIRRINLGTNTIKTIAGGGNPAAGQPGQAGFSDDNVASALFNAPKGIYVESNNLEIAVADTGNNALRLIKPPGSGYNQVITITSTSGTPGSISCTDTACAPMTVPEQCTNIQLNAPQDVIFSRIGTTGSIYNFYIADTGTHTIRYVGYDSFGGSNSCQGYLVAGSGSAGYNTGDNNQIVQFNQPVGLVQADFLVNGQPAQGFQHFFITDSGNNVIRYLNFVSGGGGSPPTAITFAGVPPPDPQSAGYAEGTANTFPSTARFNRPLGIFVKGICQGMSGNCFFPYANGAQFYVADSMNGVIRQINGNGFSSIWYTSRFFVNPADVIFKISSLTNAVGEKYDQQSFSQGICYSDLFLQSAPLSVDRTCAVSSAERLLRLQNPTNSLAEIPSLNNYLQDICYSGLSCTSITANNNCPTGTEIVSLSANTGANIETAGANGYPLASRYMICCAASNVQPPPPPSGTFSNLQWRDNLGIRIPPGSPPLCMGRILQLYAQTSGFAQGTQINFQVFDDDGLFGDDSLGFILNPSQTINNNEVRALVDLTHPYIQQLVQTALGEIGEGNDLELYFKAIGPSSTISTESYNIIIDNNLQCNYAPPTASITAPVHRGIYFTGVPVSLVSQCTSAGGIQSYSWEIKEEGTQPITIFNAPFQHSFTHPGQAHVTLTCTDFIGQTAQAEAGVLVVTTNNDAFAYIEMPAFNSVTPPPSSSIFQTEVQFKARDSFVVGINGCNVNCLGGYCKTQTENSPSSCSLTNSPLIISGAPNQQSPANDIWDDINFDWTFRGDDGWSYNGQGQGTTPINLDGLGKSTGYIYYNSISNQRNDKHLDVSISYTQGGNNLQQSFTRDFTLGRCLSNRNNYLNLNGQLQSTSTTANVCKGVDGQQNTPDDCCPTGQACTAGTGNNINNYYCQIQSRSIQRCSDFINQNECNGNTNPSIPQTSWGQLLEQCKSVKCFWNNAANNGDGACQVQLLNTPQLPGGQCNPNPGSGQVVSCNYDIRYTICTNGQKTITYNDPTTNPPVLYPTTHQCYEPSINVPCGDLNFELSFFTYAQFFFALIIVALIYIVLGIKKRK